MIYIDANTPIRQYANTPIKTLIRHRQTPPSDTTVRHHHQTLLSDTNVRCHRQMSLSHVIADIRHRDIVH
ncbi:uncharacterized protein YALI1_E27840g [Yarrowia lipolytica]|uniref:Uncharacterized protein n=1 Tax=Yarrowia lipolytica TaxID=4952 RepID=A0A1D8NJQ2_YARLL|nr:hypothetical protein YALI1_E27840g [Yarrowia lipolytica]